MYKLNGKPQTCITPGEWQLEEAVLFYYLVYQQLLLGQSESIYYVL